MASPQCLPKYTIIMESGYCQSVCIDHHGEHGMQHCICCTSCIDIEKMESSTAVMATLSQCATTTQAFIRTKLDTDHTTDTWRTGQVDLLHFTDYGVRAWCCGTCVGGLQHAMADAATTARLRRGEATARYRQRQKLKQQLLVGKGAWNGCAGSSPVFLLLHQAYGPGARVAQVRCDSMSSSLSSLIYLGIRRCKLGDAQVRRAHG